MQNDVLELRSFYNRPLGGPPIEDKSAAPRLALHAAELGFEHPTTGDEMFFDAPLPPDLAELAAALQPFDKAHAR